MKVGTAWEDITPAEPLDLLGQMSIRRGEYTLDPLTVNAVVLDDGATRMALVSCDVCMLPDAFVQEVQAGCKRSHGIAARNVLIAATHTHVAPCTVGYLFGQVNDAFMARLRSAIVGTVGRAIGNLSSCELFCGSGSIEQMGWNRRGLHANGRADMYWGSWREDFAGSEGPRDGMVSVIFARNPDGMCKAVITGFATHPNCVEGGWFYSADVPGAVRRVLRDNLGPQAGVVYLTGAAGNAAPSILEDNARNVQPWRGVEGLRRSGLHLGGEILKVISAATQPMSEPKLQLAQTELAIPLKPWPADLDPTGMASKGFQEYFSAAQADWPRMLQEESPCPVRVNVLRIGDAVVCTNPAELFVEFALEVRRHSPAKVTLISQLTDGYVGYVPTRQAFVHGGYETYPARSSKLAHDAGEQMVAWTVPALRQLFWGPSSAPPQA